MRQTRRRVPSGRSIRSCVRQAVSRASTPMWRDSSAHWRRAVFPSRESASCSWARAAQHARRSTVCCARARLRSRSACEMPRRRVPWLRSLCSTARFALSTGTRRRSRKLSERRISSPIRRRSAWRRRRMRCLPSLGRRCAHGRFSTTSSIRPRRRSSCSVRSRWAARR